MIPLRELQDLANQIYCAIQHGHRLMNEPGQYVHRQLVDKMGGTAAWEAMKAALDAAKEEFRW